MNERSVTIAGLRTIIVEPEAPVHLDVVVLHGYAMVPENLSPFAHSLGIPARFLLPEGPKTATPAGRAWWDMDAESRDLARGPRDLGTKHFPGAAPARRALLEFLAEARAAEAERRVALVGFSQGGMLACDTLLRERPDVAALALLSSSRIAADEWTPLASRLRGLPVLVAHGERDDDLAFAAGEALRDLLAAGGAEVTWVPFEQGHEIPLVVWRRLRKFLEARSAP